MKRKFLYSELLKRIKEKRRFLQVLSGPRQTGKTTLVLQVLEDSGIPSHYVTADEPGARDTYWLEQQWEIARLLLREHNSALLVVDEIQKISNWSDAVKQLWDSDTRHKLPLKVILLGSAPLLIEKGLTESLAGRFEIIAVPHWSFDEMKEAFGWTLEQFIYYGGYPGAADLIADEIRWKRYLLDSLIETTISRDIFLLTRVDKPALLRRLFQLGCSYSGQILSYQKMQGQLVDAGNTVTLAHYLNLLSGAGMLTGIEKYSHADVRQRASSPKLQALNTGLISSQDHRSFAEARKDAEYWGQLVESCVGAHLMNTTFGTAFNVTYWRERNHEVDFVVQNGKKLIGIEVKSTKRRSALPGITEFSKRFKPHRNLLIGGQGIQLEEFLSKPAAHWCS
ncbi:MAG: AAA family ATPase [Cyanobacteria bacterium PR.3.49]|jgi:predicted AAA+ superfamily ATPase|nr:AAA family ATPase [Cyanobacteria bacterium PR.3.49]